MARMRLIHRCGECAATHPKWSGRCPACGAWNSLIEEVDEPEPAVASVAAGMALVPPGVARPIAEIDPTAAQARSTGIDEVDRVLGGGLVSGSVTLLGGEPGIGKSTLLLQLLACWPSRTLYVSAEESANQVRLRAERLGALRPDLWLLAEAALPNIVAAIHELSPELVVIDSIQTVADPGLSSPPGSVVQVRACAHRLVQQAKSRDVSMILVGHVTKDGGLAGPRVLEHLVDTVLSFDGEQHHALRLLRATKHRFGPTNELGLFEMVEAGLAAVPDPSELFMADRRPGVPGSAVTPTVQGQRPLLVEVQALTSAHQGDGPMRRSAQGLDPSRLAMLLAVLEERAGVPSARMDVFTSVAGGVRLVEPGADLGICLAIASAITGRAIAPHVVASAEVGLAGELRQVAHTPRRLAEAARLGFKHAIVPANAAACRAPIAVTRAATLVEALAAAGLFEPGKRHCAA